MQFFSPYLCERFLELTQGELFPTVTLGDVAEVGPLGRRITGLVYEVVRTGR